MSSTEHKSLQTKKRAFLAAYGECGSISKAAISADITRQAHYKWIKTDPDYAELFEATQEEAAQFLEDEAVKRATEGNSDTLLIFLLKGFRPDKYRDRWQGELTAKGPITFRVEYGDRD